MLARLAPPSSANRAQRSFAPRRIPAIITVSKMNDENPHSSVWLDNWARFLVAFRQWKAVATTNRIATTGRTRRESRHPENAEGRNPRPERNPNSRVQMACPRISNLDQVCRDSDCESSGFMSGEKLPNEPIGEIRKPNRRTAEPPNRRTAEPPNRRTAEIRKKPEIRDPNAPFLRNEARPPF